MLTTRGATIAALLVALGRPVWWLLALAGFLARGGIAVFALAILSVPSPLVLSNILGPLVTPLAFGTLLPQTAVLIAVGIGLALFWLIAGGWFAAATEIGLIRDAQATAADEGLLAADDVPPARRLAPSRRLAARAAAAHLLAHVPTALVLGVSGFAIVGVVYAELANPSDAGPVAVRVVGRAAPALAAIVVAWALGELVGGLAVRRIALDGSSIVSGVAEGVRDLVRRPIGSLVMPLLTMLVLAIELGAVLATVAIVLGQVRDRLIRGVDEPVAAGLTIATLGAAWTLALVVTGLIAAWRSVALTFEYERGAAERSPAAQALAGRGQDPDEGGTIGASTDGRPGDRSTGDPDGSL
ncbi:MAG TPA: hypothetical protein VM427_05190 [Patescibacteria group bacterium]|nr:hypothetical protein [Patescibacteria group bacterium]